MTPSELGAACGILHGLWPDALIYPNPAPAPNGYCRNGHVPSNALCVDVDRVWPHECDDDDDFCTWCCGWYELVAWIDIMGRIHYEERAKLVGA